MEPIRFHPLLKCALWGGRRLGDELGKPIGSGTNFAESWEIADLPDDRSIVSSGPFSGQSIRELMQTHQQDLLGIHAERDQFPLLVKFLDAQRDLSVQVHPGQGMADRYPEVTTGKAEFWVVLDAVPGSRVSVGLKRGVDRPALESAIATGTVPDLLHTYEVRKGDCIFLEPGTVHSLGAGLLIAEVQQPNNVTYRLDDWGRRGPDGKLRELHTELALEAINFEIGPVSPSHPREIVNQPHSQVLCDNPFFVVHQHRGESIIDFPQDQRTHVLTLLSGSATFSLVAEESIRKGETIILPAVRSPLQLRLAPESLLLDSFLN